MEFKEKMWYNLLYFIVFYARSEKGMRYTVITEKKISNISELFAASFPEDIYDMKNRRLKTAFIFRGEPYNSDSLRTSFDRNYGKRYEIEERLLINFHKYGQFIEGKLSNASIWEQVVYAQHHGVPTRLLDWTFSPLVALHFALGNEYESINDSVVWALRIADITSILPDYYLSELKKTKGTVFTLELIKKIAEGFQEYDDAMGDKSFIILEPPSVDERIINQYALFTVMPKGITSLEQFILKSKVIEAYKFLIPHETKWELRCILDRININERVLFPGLDGLSQWLKRYYNFY